MGQYYLVANIDKKEYMESKDVKKLTEWSYNRNALVLAMEEKMANEWESDRIYVIGDYASSNYVLQWEDLLLSIENELLLSEESVYSYVTNNFKKIEYDENISIDIRYIFNHNTKQYVDLEHCPLDSMLGAFKDKSIWYHATIAPLPLLLAIGNGLGLGDYHSNNEMMVGMWAKDSEKLELTEEMSYKNYTEIKPDFYEGEYIPYTRKQELIEKEKQRIKKEK